MVFFSETRPDLKPIESTRFSRPSVRISHAPWLDFFAAAGVGLCAWLLFYVVTGFAFVRWDDDISVTQNPLVTAPWSHEVWSGIWTGEQAMRFQPLRWLLARVVYLVAGPVPAAWHGLGLGLHTLVSALVPLVFAGWLRRLVPSASETLIMVVAIIGGLFWALHPLRVEPVAWVTAVSYPLATLFMLVGAGAHLRAWPVNGGNPSRVWLAVAWLAAAAAVLSYPIALGFPFFLLAMELGPLRRLPGGWRALSCGQAWRWCIRHAWFMLPAALALGVTLFARYATPGIFGAAPGLAQTGIGDRVIAALASVSWYPLRILFPVNLNANLAPMITEKGWDPLLWVHVLVTILMATWVWKQRRSRPDFAWAVIGFCALALPCLGLTEQPVWPVDRYSYHLDLILICVAGVVILKYLQRSGQRVRILLSISMTLGLSATVLLSRELLMHWRDTDALFTRFESSRNFTASAAQSAHVYRLWAYHHGAQGDEARAQSLLARARAVYREAMSVRLARGDYLGAIELAYTQEAALGADPSLTRERGWWWWRLGRAEEAKRDLQAALKLQPAEERTHILLRIVESGGSQP